MILKLRWTGRALVVPGLLALATAGCAGAPSPLDPRTAATARIAELGWILIALAVAATIAWLWPSKEEREQHLVSEANRAGGAGNQRDETRTLHGLPGYPSGTGAPGWWTMVHIVIVIAVATACLVMSYYYLRPGTAAWPPAGYPGPDLLLPGLATLALLVGALFVWWAERRIRSGAQGQLKLGLAGAGALGLAFLALLASDTMRSGISPAAQAYDSAVATLLGYQAVLVVGGLILLGVVQAQAWLGCFSARRFLAVQNTALYCIAVAVNWLVIFGVVYLTPLVLGTPAYQVP